MAVTFDTSAVISACGKAGQICLADTVFWMLALMFAIGVIRAIAELMAKKPEAGDWRKGTDRETPEGFKWVLVRESDLADK